MFCFPPRITQPDQSSPTTDVYSETFLCLLRGCQDFTLSFFLSSELFHLLGVGEFSQLLNNFKISPSLHIIIPGRSHAPCWFNLRCIISVQILWFHISRPDSSEDGEPACKPTAEKFTTFSRVEREATLFFIIFSLTTSLLITSAERSSQTWVFSRWSSPPTFPVSPVEATR